MLWANLHLLFWLSLIHFITTWMGENHFAPTPIATYGIVLLAVSIAYFIQTKTLLAVEGHDSALARAVGHDIKGGISSVLSLLALPLTFVNVGIPCSPYALVATLWLVPDHRIEHVIAS